MEKGLYFALESKDNRYYDISFPFRALVTIFFQPISMRHSYKSIIKARGYGDFPVWLRSHATNTLSFFYESLVSVQQFKTRNYDSHDVLVFSRGERKSVVPEQKWLDLWGFEGGWSYRNQYSEKTAW